MSFLFRISVAKWSGLLWICLSAPLMSQQIPPGRGLPARQMTQHTVVLPPVAAVNEAKRLDQPKVIDSKVQEHAFSKSSAWYAPSFWWNSQHWERSLELGLSGSAGNTETMSLQFGTEWERKTQWSQFDVGLVYHRARSQQVKTKHNGLFNIGHHWLLGDSRWSPYVKSAAEYDEFKAFDLRFVLNSGFRYRFCDWESLTLDGRLGAGTSTEFGGPDNRWAAEAILGGDYEHKWTDRQKAIIKWDYFPQWDNPSDFRIVAKASWELMLSEPENLSFKINVIDRYDSSPHDRKPNDIDYSFVVMWKY